MPPPASVAPRVRIVLERPARVACAFLAACIAAGLNGSGIGGGATGVGAGMLMVGDGILKRLVMAVTYTVGCTLCMLTAPQSGDLQMQTTRRDFVRMMALLAAGAAALPEQIDVFQRYYEANTPLIGGPFIAVDEVFIGGLASGGSTPIRLNLFAEDINVLPLALNAFGGVAFWRASPDGKLVSQCSDFRYAIEHLGDDSEWRRPSDSWIRQTVHGYIKYIDEDALRHTVLLETAAGTLS
jgi:hypothetical protein